VTKEEIKERISLLSDEMDANDEENRMMQREVDQLYSMLDKMHELENE
jgi:pyrroloquinoline quinone (PQQ) biosynthesis protein C